MLREFGLLRLFNFLNFLGASDFLLKSKSWTPFSSICMRGFEVGLPLADWLLVTGWKSAGDSGGVPADDISGYTTCQPETQANNRSYCSSDTDLPVCRRSCLDSDGFISLIRVQGMSLFDTCVKMKGA